MPSITSLYTENSERSRSGNLQANCSKAAPKPEVRTWAASSSSSSIFVLNPLFSSRTWAASSPSSTIFFLSPLFSSRTWASSAVASFSSLDFLSRSASTFPEGFPSRSTSSPVWPPWPRQLFRPPPALQFSPSKKRACPLTQRRPEVCCAVSGAIQLCPCANFGVRR